MQLALGVRIRASEHFEREEEAAAARWRAFV
jgi:hypothetical protein